MHKNPHEIIKNGSKSFSFAGAFFSKDQWEGVTQVYHWCRHCDDVIDENGGEEALKTLRAETISALCNEKISSGPYLSLQQVAKRFSIPVTYPLELLNGMEMDTQGKTYRTLKELELYCYRVASTVGLMMCYIMGIFRISALQNAAHLGIAMQLTNISRDVKEDFINGRVYLPLDWLEEESITKEKLFHQKEKLYKVVLRLLKSADDYYESGLQGIRDLPLRSAFVITLAAMIYREIGNEIRKKGISSLERRTVVPLYRKIFLVGKALSLILTEIPARIFRKNQKVQINQIWSPL